MTSFLLHITHYDPFWCENKDKEEKFNLKVAKQIIDKLENKITNLVIDIKDGMIYDNIKPSITRHYSVPKETIKKLVDYARSKNMKIIPKINLAKSPQNKHDHWLHPHTSDTDWLLKSDDYWTVVSQVIKQIIEVCEPEEYFHLGFDEDHSRSDRIMIHDINKASDIIIKNHKLTPIIWDDRCYINRDVRAEVYAEKIRRITPKLNKKLIHVLWDYDESHEWALEELRQLDRTVWVAPGMEKLDNVRRWKHIMNDNEELLYTTWLPTIGKHRKNILSQINNVFK